MEQSQRALDHNKAVVILHVSRRDPKCVHVSLMFPVRMKFSRDGRRALRDLLDVYELSAWCMEFPVRFIRKQNFIFDGVKRAFIETFVKDLLHLLSNADGDYVLQRDPPNKSEHQT